MTRGSFGFTLVELLVVISIITVLSVTGLTVFSNARNQAQQAKRKADIDAIKKAYESNYDPTANGGQGGYKPIQPSNFSSNKIPTPDGTTTTSYLVIGPETAAVVNNTAGDGSAPNYAACVSVSTGNRCLSSSSDCYCQKSNQGQVFTQANPASTCDSLGVLKTGLVGYWNMDDASWSGFGAVKDQSGNNNNGTASGAFNTNTPPLPSASFIKYGSFSEGTAPLQNVQVPHNTSLNLGNKFTISLWLYPVNYGDHASGNWDPPLDKQGSWQFVIWQYGNWLNIRQPGGCLTGLGGDISFAVSGGIPQGAWTHLVTTYDSTAAGNNFKIYKNGNIDTPVYSARYTASGFCSSVSPLYIGSRSASELYKGKIDEVRLFNRALSPSEVSILYGGGQGCF